MKSVLRLSVLVGLILVVQPILSNASAQEYWLGEIKMVGFDFCPSGTVPADGRLLSIGSNTALFSLYDTLYGGDGRITFAVPDLRGRVPMGNGEGAGLSDRELGSKGGYQETTLRTPNLPSHTHNLGVSNNTQGPNTADPNGNAFAKGDFYTTHSPDITLSTGTISLTGQNVPFNILPPFQTIRYCVVVTGFYPSRN